MRSIQARIFSMTGDGPAFCGYNRATGGARTECAAQQPMGQDVMSGNDKTRRRRLLAGLCLGLAATLSLLLAESLFRPYVWEGLYFQGWSSETLMQAVSIEDLRDEPLRSLWYLHIQPPLYDGLRAALALPWSRDDPASLLRKVDLALYAVWAVLYGAMGAVVYWWLLAEGCGPVFSGISNVLFLLHPASIFYATLLDTTLLTAFLVLCLFFLLRRVSRGANVPCGLLVASFLALFFTRSLFQWPWIALIAVSLVVMGYPLRKTAIFVCAAGLLVGLYAAKQEYLFHTAGSSFTGYNLCNSIGYHVYYAGYAEQAEPAYRPDPSKPKVLSRLRKINGRINYNNELYLEVNRGLVETYKALMIQATPAYLARNYLGNLKNYLSPSSRYTVHALVDRLSYRTVYDVLFSFPALVILLAAAGGFWYMNANRSERMGGLGLLLPAAFLVFLSVFFEQGENMRFKFFLEPVMFVFIACEARRCMVLAAGRIRSSTAGRRTEGEGKAKG